MTEIAINATSVSAKIIIGPRNPPEVKTVYRNLLNIGLPSLIYSVTVKRIPITVLILTKNEELAISAAINSVKRFDQVIVVDSNSTDSTISIAKSLGCEVKNFVWNGQYPKKKQWAMNIPEIKHDWVLYLDADERIEISLEQEIENIFQNQIDPKISAFQVSLDYEFLGTKLKFGHKVKKVVLLNRHQCFFPELDDLEVKNMWEVEGHYQPQVEFDVKQLHGCIYHVDPDPLFDYFARHNRYSDWEAALHLNPQLKQIVDSHRSIQGRFFSYIPFKPILFFAYSWILKSGWRDGRAGFNYAISLAFYYWQISVKQQELRLIKTRFQK